MNPVKGSEVVWKWRNLIVSVDDIDPSEPSQDSYYTT